LQLVDRLSVVRLARKIAETGSAIQPLCLCPAGSCSDHIFSLCQLITLTIHNSLCLLLPAQDLHLSQIFPTIDSLPGLKTDFMDSTTGPFLLSISVLTARRNARIASAILTTAIPSVCLSVRPYVRLSHAGIVSKRRHVARCSLHCQIAKCL